MAGFASTTTALGSSATFTSGTLHTHSAEEIRGMVFANQAGNLFIEQSSDGTNWDVSTSTAVVANTGAGFVQPIYGNYARIRYVNGGVAQTIFRLSAKVYRTAHN